MCICFIFAFLFYHFDCFYCFYYFTCVLWTFLSEMNLIDWLIIFKNKAPKSTIECSYDQETNGFTFYWATRNIANRLMKYTVSVRRRLWAARCQRKLLVDVLLGAPRLAKTLDEALTSRKPVMFAPPWRNSSTSSSSNACVRACHRAVMTVMMIMAIITIYF